MPGFQQRVLQWFAVKQNAHPQSVARHHGKRVVDGEDFDAAPVLMIGHGSLHLVGQGRLGLKFRNDLAALYDQQFLGLFDCPFHRACAVLTARPGHGPVAQVAARAVGDAKLTKLCPAVQMAVLDQDVAAVAVDLGDNKRGGFEVRVQNAGEYGTDDRSIEKLVRVVTTVTFYLD